MGQRLFFRRIAKNRDYIQSHCNDINNPFHFACRQWYSYTNTSIIICIFVKISLIFLIFV